MSNGNDDYNKPSKLISAYAHVELYGRQDKHELLLYAVCPRCRYRMTKRQTKELIKRLDRSAMAYCGMCLYEIDSYRAAGLTHNYGAKPTFTHTVETVCTNDVLTFKAGRITAAERERRALAREYCKG